MDTKELSSIIYEAFKAMPDLHDRWSLARTSSEEERPARVNDIVTYMLDLAEPVGLLDGDTASQDELFRRVETHCYDFMQIQGETDWVGFVNYCQKWENGSVYDHLANMVYGELE